MPAPTRPMMARPPIGIFSSRAAKRFRQQDHEPGERDAEHRDDGVELAANHCGTSLRALRT